MKEVIQDKQANNGFSQRIPVRNARADESAVGAINRPLRGEAVGAD